MKLITAAESFIVEASGGQLGFNLSPFGYFAIREGASSVFVKGLWERS